MFLWSVWHEFIVTSLAVTSPWNKFKNFNSCKKKSFSQKFWKWLLVGPYFLYYVVYEIVDENINILLLDIITKWKQF